VYGVAGCPERVEAGAHPVGEDIDAAQSEICDVNLEDYH